MKDEQQSTLKKILTVAQKEFLEKGFRDASLRNMVKKAGVTTGAFYGYFKSKEELFDALVQKHYEYILQIYDDILLKFKNMSLEEQKDSMDNYASIGLQSMFDYIWENKRPFRMILYCAGGTRYENFVHEISKRDIASTESFYNLLETQGNEVERIDPLIEEMVVTSTFNSFFTLVLRDISKAEAEKGLTQMFRFYRGGWNSLMHFSDS